MCDAIKQYPWLNSTWSDEGVVLKHYINMGIAVSIPDGLIVPVLKDADQRGFTDLVASINDLVVRARSKQLKPDDVQGGTFTLNNTDREPADHQSAAGGDPDDRVDHQAARCDRRWHRRAGHDEHVPQLRPPDH